MPVTNGVELSHLIGFFLAKYNKKAVHALGFNTYKALYDTYGPICGRKPNGLKNIRDEYDPLLNDRTRSGWYQRGSREIIKKNFQKYNSWSFDELLELILSSTRRQ